MNYPLISKYIEAIKSAEDNFEELSYLRPVLGDDGLPVMTSGNFAVGFKNTLETLLWQHSSRPRNKNIANAFFKAGFIDAWGRGYKKIREGFEGAGLPMPEVANFCGGVRVSFMRNNINSADVTKDVIKDVAKELTDRQKVILEMIADDPSLTAKAMSEKMSEKDSVNERTIERDIAKLKKTGILIRKGGRKDGEWVINVKNK